MRSRRGAPEPGAFSTPCARGCHALHGIVVATRHNRPCGPPARLRRFMSSRPCGSIQTGPVSAAHQVLVLNMVAVRPDRSGGEQRETTSCRSSRMAKTTGAHPLPSRANGEACTSCVLSSCTKQRFTRHATAASATPAESSSIVQGPLPLQLLRQGHQRQRAHQVCGVRGLRPVPGVLQVRVPPLIAIWTLVDSRGTSRPSVELC